MCIAVEAGLEKRRYLLFASPHGAGASRRNCDAQKAYCFQHGLNCNPGYQTGRPQEIFFWTVRERCGIISRVRKTVLLLSNPMSTRSLMDRTEASDAFNAGSIPVECTFYCGRRSFRFFCLRIICAATYIYESVSHAHNRMQDQTSLCFVRPALPQYLTHPHHALLCPTRQPGIAMRPQGGFSFLRKKDIPRSCAIFMDLR